MTIASGKPGFTTLFGPGTVLVGDTAVLVPRLAIATVQVDARMALALAGHFKNPLLKNTQQLFMTVGDDANPGGAAPRGGRLTVDPTGTYSASERAAAQHMADLGHDVTLRPPTGTRAGGGTSDLLVDGVRYDVYTPTTGNPSRIIGAIAKKNSQAEGVVLDLSGTTVTQADLGNVLARVQAAGGTNIRNIVVIGGR